MAQNTRFTPYGRQTVESLDEDAGDPEFMAYGTTPSMAKKDCFLPEDIPLFLSNDAAEPRQRAFGSGGARNLDRAAVWSRVFRASLLVASAAGIAVTILSVENPLALFANAKASLIGVSAVRPDATPKSPSEPIVAARPAIVQPTPASQSTVGVGNFAPAEKASPTRDEIALALRAAHQGQPEIRQPPARRLDADELATLLTRARSLIALGDIAPARLLLERAADAQEAGAALLLAQTYDPAVLGTQDTRSITPDPAKARDWYQKAAQFGSQDARQRLSQIQN
jgi:hypothetical protein